MQQFGVWYKLYGLWSLMEWSLMEWYLIERSLMGLPLSGAPHEYTHLSLYR